MPEYTTASSKKINGDEIIKLMGEFGFFKIENINWAHSLQEYDTNLKVQRPPFVTLVWGTSNYISLWHFCVIPI